MSIQRATSGALLFSGATLLVSLFAYASIYTQVKSIWDELDNEIDSFKVFPLNQKFKTKIRFWPMTCGETWSSWEPVLRPTEFVVKIMEDTELLEFSLLLHKLLTIFLISLEKDLVGWVFIDLLRDIIFFSPLPTLCLSPILSRMFLLRTVVSVL